MEGKEARKEEKKKKHDAEEPPIVEEQLSEEDKALKEKLELLVERLKDPQKELRLTALNTLTQEVKSATSSMTSVPKPLKFLKNHYEPLKQLHSEIPADDPFKASLSDLIAVLAITLSERDSLETLKFTLRGTLKNVTSWGHEYLRTLAGEIGNTYVQRVQAGEPTEDLLNLVLNEILPHHMKHNAEHEAVDLLHEVNRLPQIIQYTTQSNYKRVCLYMSTLAPLAADPEELRETFTTALEIFMKMEGYPEALRVALRLNSMPFIQKVMEAVKDRATALQLAFMLGRQRVNFDQESITALAQKIEPTEKEAEELNERLTKIISNEKLSQYFHILGEELDSMEPRTPEYIFRTALEKGRAEAMISSSKENLASTIVNAFLNAGFGKDKFMLGGEESWISKNKLEGVITATASIGMITMWDCENGVQELNKYMDANDPLVVSGALMGLGLVHSGVRNEFDPVIALCGDKLESPAGALKVGAVVGLGMAYAGSEREDVLEMMAPFIIDPNENIDLNALAALNLGLVFVGSCNEEVAQCVIETLMERSPEALEHPMARYFGLALGLIYFGQQDKCEAILETVKLVEPKFGKFVQILIEACAYAGTGNVLKIQKMLHECAKHHKEDKDAFHQIAAVLGVALIAMGQEIGTQMALRTMNHLLQYGQAPIRKTAPLAIGLMSICNPEIAVADTLGKICYDQNVAVSKSALFALGLISAGTNNSRVSDQLRSLSSYYLTDASRLFTIRLSQGLLHLGKGLLTINPNHSEGMLLSNVALGGILTVLFACTEFEKTIETTYSYLIYYLGLAVYPRMLMTVNEDLKPTPVQVRVGQAVDVVAQAGQPKRITGFQTHNTPVLIGNNERAEMATDEYEAQTPVMENLVIVKKCAPQEEKIDI